MDSKLKFAKNNLCTNLEQKLNIFTRLRRELNEEQKS